MNTKLFKVEEPPFDPAFRVAVLMRIETRAARRTAQRRALAWLLASALATVVAPQFTASDNGAPALELTAMFLSIIATAGVTVFVLAQNQASAARTLLNALTLRL